MSACETISGALEGPSADYSAQEAWNRWQAAGRGWRAVWPWALALSLLLGACLRFVWITDIEYKVDEAWMVQHARHAPDALPLESFGMPTSIGIPNPGMSTWVFRALSILFDARTPLAFARSVQAVNVAALALLAIFALAIVPRAEREAWLWAVVLGAVNPLAVLFQRKIWPPSVLPLFTVAMLLAWWYRERRWGAFFWGLLGVVIGQIHLAGFFLAGGFVVWAWLFDRRRVAWRGWTAGSCVGALPLIPWAAELLGRSGVHFNHGLRWTHILEMKFWMRWFTEPFGVGLEYSLEDDYADYLRGPAIGGHSTYLVLLLHAAVIALAAVIAARAGRWLWKNRNEWGALWVGKSSETAFTQAAALWGFGILLTASTASIYRHYLIVAFPLTFVWLARLVLVPRPEVRSQRSEVRSQRSEVRGQRSEIGDRREVRRGRMLLAAVCVLELLLTISFLGYIHVNQRPIHGDYGTPYAAQQPVIRALIEQFAARH